MAPGLPQSLVNDATALGDDEETAFNTQPAGTQIGQQIRHNALFSN
jgi:hypothetical protein